MFPASKGRSCARVRLCSSGDGAPTVPAGIIAGEIRRHGAMRSLEPHAACVANNADITRARHRCPRRSRTGDAAARRSNSAISSGPQFRPVRRARLMTPRVFTRARTLTIDPSRPEVARQSSPFREIQSQILDARAVGRKIRGDAHDSCNASRCGRNANTRLRNPVSPRSPSRQRDS